MINMLFVIKLKWFVTLLIISAIFENIGIFSAKRYIAEKILQYFMFYIFKISRYFQNIGKISAMFKNLKKLFLCLPIFADIFADIANKMFSGPSLIFCQYRYFQHWFVILTIQMINTLLLELRTMWTWSFG